MLLAAAPVITLPVVRLIRDAMLYEVPSPLPVAEVFLSGLLLRLSGQEQSEQVQPKLDQQDPEQPEENELEQEQSNWQDLVQYDFAPRVRNILLKLLPEVDTIDVINSVSAAVERRWNQFSNESFQAFLTNPNVEAPEELAGLRSFASVTAEILETLGGEEYTKFAQKLRHGSGESPIVEPGLDHDDFPLEDLEYEVAKLRNFPPLQPCDYESATITAILDRFEFETATVKKKKRSSKGKGRAGWEINRQAASTWGYTESLSIEGGEDIGLEMIAIPAGSFMMGAPESEPESEDNERPQHEVALQPFYLGRYPVTQAQWRIVAGYERVDQELDPDPSDFKGDNRPVENVSWADAQEFCKRLSVQTGKAYHLPSEAQWEYACRAGTETPFHFGETITPELANYDGNYTYNDSPKGKYRNQTTNVSSFLANEWGLYDLHGNVNEWCEDDWHDSYEGAPSDGSAWVESVGEASPAENLTGSRRLLRGGSWSYYPWYGRSAYRRYTPRDYRTSFFGFRVCCVPPRLSS